MDAFDKLVEIMRTLRGPGGCPWDQAQTLESLTPYTIEESYELVQSIETKDWQELRKELGDLLFHIVFYAEIAREQGLFSIEEVAQAAVDKMIRRHPHVFGEESITDLDTLNKRWQALKAEELKDKPAEAETAWDAGIPGALPALLWSYKLQERAANLGFEWHDIAPVWAKCAEEWQELKDAVAIGNPAEIIDEYGDVLFALVNLSRFLDVHPEQALRQSCGKFRERLNEVQVQARKQDLNLQDLSDSELDALWESAKRELARRRG